MEIKVIKFKCDYCEKEVEDYKKADGWIRITGDKTFIVKHQKNLVEDDLVIVRDFITSRSDPLDFCSIKCLCNYILHNVGRKVTNINFEKKPRRLV